jgi:pimeloyl-ACP methyl ester carboxylesterase
VSALEAPPEFATVPDAIVAAICEWLGTCEPGAAGPPPGRAAARLHWEGVEIDERVLTIGEHGNVGVLAAPLEPDPSLTTLVFLNPGSETHIGPGRAWVEYARALAVLGHRSVRVDFRGWGESPDDGRAPGRPYDACGEDDAVEIVQGLRAAGHERVALFGLCASAWIALRAVLHAPVSGVIALNPQMYWKPGDPVEIDWDLIRARRATEIRRVAVGARWRLWTLLDLVGHRPRPAAWLSDLRTTGVPIQLLFAQGDDGLQFLSQRLGRRLARVQKGGTITVRELPEVDHPMHRTWLRPRVVQAIHEELERIDAV